MYLTTTPAAHLRFVSPKGGTAVSGDFHSTPRRVSTMLMNSTYSELNILDRSADYRNEVGWRLKLRSNTPSEYQIRQHERNLRMVAKARARAKVPRNSTRHHAVDSVGPLISFMVGEGIGSENTGERERKEREEIERKREEALREKEERVVRATEYIKNLPDRKLFLKNLI